MEIEMARGDTMINPKFRTPDGKFRTFDIVVANPMWNQPFNPDIFANDPFDRFRSSVASRRARATGHGSSTPLPA